MKKITLALFVALISALTFAQGPGGKSGPGGPGGGRDPKARFEKMKKDLNLTPAQAKKVEDLQNKMRAEMKKLRDTPGDMRAKGPQMKKIFEGYSADMKKILNKDQQAKFDAMMKQRMRRMGEGRGPGGPGGGRPGQG